jgi:ABC-type transport system involved in cytochrome bd biosynthesis fused ATPase/permease subunit
MRVLTIVAIAGLVAAVVMGLLASSTLAYAIALSIGGVASVLGVCLAFYAVGRAEDRARARDRAAQDS